MAHKLSQNLLRLRKASGMTQIALSEKAGVNRRYFQQIEAGEKNPTCVIAAKIRKALECDWDDLLQGM